MPALLALSLTALPHYALKFAETERDSCCLAMMATLSVAMAAAAPVKYRPDISVLEALLIPGITAVDRLPEH